MKKFAYLVTLAALPVLLVGCTNGSNANTNTAVIDLVNESANVNAAAPANTNTSTPANTNTAANTNVAAAKNVNVAATAVTLTASGYSPATVTVKVGQTVTWTNSSGSSATVTSDPHPTHTDLPGFDSPTLAEGGTYQYTFTQKGSWGYHNHLDPTTKGTVVVQ